MDNQHKMNLKNVFSADTQAALTAIDLLASDIGSIFNMVSITNFDSQIYIETKSIHKEMNEIAANADKGQLDLVRLSEVVSKIDKLSSLIHRKKALNPLIPNDLVELVSVAVNDSYIAIALTTNALK
jgi:hypothetical protein